LKCEIIDSEGTNKYPLLIAPEGIEITGASANSITTCQLLIAPEGIEMAAKALLV